MRHLLLLALLAPSTSFAASTGAVTVLLKNAGAGRFSSLDRVQVVADVDIGTDKVANVPGSGAAAPGVAFNAVYFGLVAYDGTAGTYRMYVTFPDAEGVKTVELGSAVNFPGGSSFFSTLGVTSTNPGSAYAFEIANDAPAALAIDSCAPTADNPTQNLALSWTIGERPGDFEKYLLQRAPAVGDTWTTVGTYTTWGATSFVDTSRTPATEYRYRLVHQDRYDAITEGPQLPCATSDGDLDGDGFVGPAYGGDDCDDADPSVYPGAPEIPGDEIDQDCDGADLEGVADTDGDEVPDHEDNCPEVANVDQSNFDGDAAGNVCDPDDDNDGVPDVEDLCVTAFDPVQSDLDGDLAGDVCDDDDDNDGVNDDIDVCPRVSDPDQSDLDHDLVGDVCDGDDDGDGVSDEVDVCPDIADDQTDSDGDGVGDACDPFTDTDADLVVDTEDNCPLDANDEQLDTDGDGAGDACDVDDDNDGVDDLVDVCPVNSDPAQEDADADSLGNACDEDDDNDGVVDEIDNCVFDANGGQSDLDGDGAGDACDDDDDGDAIDDAADNCLGLANPEQFDNDADGFGDLCDADDDDDGVLDDAPDNCHYLFNSDQADLDADTLGDVCDPDDDGDGWLDAADNCPVDWNDDQLDTDADLLGDVCDPDDDADGVLDPDDLCALVSDPDQADSDCDGAGDACDEDVDGDGLENDMDYCPEEAALPVDLDEDGCRDDACVLEDWIGSRTTREIATQMVRSMTRQAASACAGEDDLDSLASHTRAQRGKKVAPDTADTILEAIEWIETAERCATSGVDCDLLDVCTE